MAKASDNQFPSVLFTEGAVPAGPAAGDQRIYIDVADHHLKRVDENDAVVDLETDGAPDAANITYTPTVATDWDSDADPGDLVDALDQLAERVDDLEGATIDAGDVTYTPTTAADWDSDADPGDLDDALDQLAERVDDLEGAVSARKGIIGFTIDGGGAEIEDGFKGIVPVPAAATIKAVRMYADQSGSIVVDIWKDTYANYPPTDADTITAAAVPTITTATKSEDATLTDWTVALSEGDVLAFNVDSCTTIERCVVALFVEYS